MPSDPLNGLGITVELNLGLEKSGNSVLSGKWQPSVTSCDENDDMHHSYDFVITENAEFIGFYCCFLGTVQDYILIVRAGKEQAWHGLVSPRQCERVETK